MSMTRISCSAALGCALLLTAGTSFADLKAGQSLHESNCLKCHGDEVYTRENRKVTSLPALHRQVKRCELSLGLTWFDEQVEDVVQYLNQSYYNLK